MSLFVPANLIISRRLLSTASRRAPMAMSPTLTKTSTATTTTPLPTTTTTTTTAASVVSSTFVVATTTPPPPLSTTTTTTSTTSTSTRSRARRRGAAVAVAVAPRRAFHTSTPPRMFIQVQRTPNPDSNQFFPGETVLGAGVGTRDYPSATSAFESPLAKRLFAVDGVTRVFLAGDYVTVSKRADVQWEQLQPHVFAILTDYFQDDARPPIVDPDARPNADTAIDEDDDDVVVEIKELLESKVRPSVQEDGGDIQFVAFEEGVVFLKMLGSCDGCPSSGATLKQGIERMLMHWVPEVVGVVQVTDDELDRLNLSAFAKLEEKLKARNGGGDDESTTSTTSTTTPGSV